MISELPGRIDRLLVDSGVLARSRELVDPFRVRRLEVCLLWYGYVLDAETCFVTTCVQPEQINRATTYEISAEAMREARHKLRPHRLLLIVQLHTHPARAYFSKWDQAHALNNRPGALNMVIPNYGDVPWIDAEQFCMVERNEAGHWRPWSLEDWTRMAEVPDVLALRGNDG